MLSMSHICRTVAIQCIARIKQGGRLSSLEPRKQSPTVSDQKITAVNIYRVYLLQREQAPCLSGGYKYPHPPNASFRRSYAVGRDPRAVSARSRSPQTPLICRPPKGGSTAGFRRVRPWAACTWCAGGCTGLREAGHVVGNHTWCGGHRTATRSNPPLIVFKLNAVKNAVDR